MPRRPRSDVAHVVVKATLAARAGRHVRGSRESSMREFAMRVRVERNVMKFGT